MKGGEPHVWQLGNRREGNHIQSWVAVPAGAVVDVGRIISGKVDSE